MTVIYGIEQPPEIDQVNAEYKQRHLELLKKRKTNVLGPADMVELQEWLRQQYIRIAAVRDGKPVTEPGAERAPRKRKGWKADLVTGWVDKNLNVSFKPEDLAVTLDVSVPTVYNWIKANRGRLLKVSRGQYQVVDRTDERKQK